MTTVFDTIKKRRSIGKMTDQQPSREQIERLIEAATHAPNHRHAEPWKFFVLTGEARAQLGEIFAAIREDTIADLAQASKEAILANERKKLLRAPVILVVCAEHANHPNILDIENIEAVAAAVQNMLLVAEEMGLASIWKTGNAAYDTRVKQWLGLTEKDHIVAFLYVGYPAITVGERQPQLPESKTTWLGWSNQSSQNDQSTPTKKIHSSIN